MLSPDWITPLPVDVIYRYRCGIEGCGRGWEDEPQETRAPGYHVMGPNVPKGWRLLFDASGICRLICPTHVLTIKETCDANLD